MSRVNLAIVGGGLGLATVGANAAYFRNLTDRDVTGEVIFPLPPISLQALMSSDFNIHEGDRENLVDFTATVNGQPVPTSIDRIAVIEPPWDEARPLSAQYDTPGTDVTAAIRAARALDIPVVGLDLLVPAADQPDYVFIEANERAGLANHEPQPTAERFVDLLFPHSQPAP